MHLKSYCTRCAHTYGDGGRQWFSLQLDGPQTVAKVQIARRTDRDSQGNTQGKNITITVGPSREYDQDEPLCLPEIPDLRLYGNGLVDYNCNKEVTGRYVKISRHHDNGGFAICEVKVFISPRHTRIRGQGEL